MFQSSRLAATRHTSPAGEKKRQKLADSTPQEEKNVGWVIIPTWMKTHTHIYIYIYIYIFTMFVPVVPHKAVAETLWERSAAAMHGWQSESTDGPKGGWSCGYWSNCNGCCGHLTHNSWMQCGVVQ